MTTFVTGLTLAFEALRLLAIVGPAVAKALRSTIETFKRLAEQWKTVEPEDVASTFDELQRLARGYVLNAATLDLGTPPPGKDVADLRWDSALRALKEAAQAMLTPLPDRIAEKIVQDAYVDARNDADTSGVTMPELAELEGQKEPAP